jgi:hypothetical protein
MKKFLFVVFFINVSVVLSQASKSPQWLIKSNWILNPGAEANDNSIPLKWKTDFKESGESNWVSAYGVTSHEWNSGGKMLGLPESAGNNYFRLTVNNHDGNRKINLYQEIALSEIQNYLTKDTVMASFSCQIASNSFLPENCSFSEVRLIYLDDSKQIVDSLIFRRVPSEFKDLDANSQETIDRGFSVMHEFKALSSNHQVNSKARNLRLEIYAEFPCYVKNEDDETPFNYSNTFFFDNLFLGFYKK